MSYISYVDKEAAADVIDELYEGRREGEVRLCELIRSFCTV